MRSYLIGRRADCDFVVDAEGVADRHAEVVLLPDGRCHVTDRGTSGTFVYRGARWRAIQQDFVGPDERLKFGQHEIPAAALQELSLIEAGDTRASAGKPAPAAPSAQASLVRDPLTGEIIENPSR